VKWPKSLVHLSEGGGPYLSVRISFGHRQNGRKRVPSSSGVTLSIPNENSFHRTNRRGGNKLFIGGVSLPEGDPHEGARRKKSTNSLHREVDTLYFPGE